MESVCGGRKDLVVSVVFLMKDLSSLPLIAHAN